MAVRSSNAHWRVRDIRRRHWLELGRRHAIVTPEGGDAESVVNGLAASTPAVVTRVRSLLPAGFPSALADTILGGLQAAADKLAA